jgi:hypothetical protein
MFKIILEIGKCLCYEYLHFCNANTLGMHIASLYIKVICRYFHDDIKINCYLGFTMGQHADLFWRGHLFNTP